MSDLPLFDSNLGHELKVQGMNAAAENKRDLLENVKRGVEMIARFRPDRTATADDAAKWLVDNGLDPHALGNAAGSLFLDKKVWQFTHRFTKSKRPWARGNLLRVWELK